MFWLLGILGAIMAVQGRVHDDSVMRNLGWVIFIFCLLVMGIVHDLPQILLFLSLKS